MTVKETHCQPPEKDDFKAHSYSLSADEYMATGIDD